MIWWYLPLCGVGSRNRSGCSIGSPWEFMRLDTDSGVTIMEQERRRGPRRRVLKTAKIVFNHGHSAVDVPSEISPTAERCFWSPAPLVFRSRLSSCSMQQSHASNARSSARRRAHGCCLSSTCPRPIRHRISFGLRTPPLADGFMAVPSRRLPDVTRATTRNRRERRSHQADRL